VWLFGLAPLMVSLFVLYSVLWWWNRRARRYFSPITRLANALEHIDWEDYKNQASPFHDLILDTATQQLTRAGQNIELPPIQFKLLKLLMRHSPKVLTKQEIMMQLWGDEEPESDALRSHIYNLRKMVDKPFEQKLIHTISGIGLKIALEDEA
jgi:DNA-binding response OmpR family regulator